MKKLITSFILIISVAVCLCCGALFSSGCSGWQEVQSITYSINLASKTLTSTCVWNITSGYITQDEYENAPDEQKIQSDIAPYYLFPSSLDIDKNRKDFLNTENSLVGKTYYYYNAYYYNAYFKYTCNSYTLNYVKVKFLSENSLEINYDGQTTKIFPTSYEITYFIN